MPYLARHIQERFVAACPPGWTCEAEAASSSRRPKGSSAMPPAPTFSSPSRNKAAGSG